MQIKLNKASFGYGGETLFRDVSLEINSGDKIAIIGKNGCGKTTLLKVIAGEIELHQEENMPPVFEVSGNPYIATLKQMSFDDESVSLEDEILKCYAKVRGLENKLGTLQAELEQNYSDKLVENFSRVHDEFERLGGYKYRAELNEVLSNFGLLEEKDKKLSEFSGGQKTKIAFIKLILSKPDVLLLDEPTNHLDIRAISWLENYIKNYKNTVIIVSHDRTFLDNTVSFVCEIEHKKLTKYTGGYTDFVKTKQSNYESNLKAYEAQQRKIADINEFIERFRYKATKANAVQSRIKMLEKMEIIPKPTLPDESAFKGKIKPEITSGTEVLSCTNLKIGYDKKRPLASVNFKINRGDRLGIIGGNGTGKTTLLATITEKIPALSGYFKFGYNVVFGYFEQIESKFYSNKSVFAYFSENFPDLSGTEVRSKLGAFLFGGEDAGKPLSSLSGGEIVRLELCLLIEKKPNLLILDEPTNHMDICSKETFENLISNYEGTVIFVSHDRYFTNKIANKLLIFENGEAKFFDGTLKEYNEPFSKPTLETQENKIPEIKPDKIEYPIDFGEEPENPLLSLSPYMASKEKSKLEVRLKKIEEKSKASEEALKKLNADFVDPNIASDFKKLMEIQAEIENTEILISKLASEWVEVAENLEVLKSVSEKPNDEK